MINLLLKKSIYLIVFFTLLFAFSHTLILFSYLITKNKESANLTKSVITDTLSLIYQYGFNSSIYYSGKYIASNNIDIVIANHISTIDFGIFLSIINHFDDRNMFFIMKKDVVFFPSFGFVTISSPDLKLSRKMELDKSNITTAIRKIKSGVIVIMPEGTRFTPEKQMKAQQFSRNNNLPLFKNTLYPKMKGLWLIVNILKEEKRLGNLIDISNVIENFKGKAAYLPQILTKDMGRTYSIIQSYSIPNDKQSSINLEDYDEFKKWFLEIWKQKDMALENVDKPNYYTFKKLGINTKKSTYILILIIF